MDIGPRGSPSPFDFDAYLEWMARHGHNFTRLWAWEPIRRSMGYTLRYSRRMNLAATRPRGELSSTGYCLANPGVEYLVFLPGGGTATVDLSAAPDDLSVE